MAFDVVIDRSSITFHIAGVDTVEQAEEMAMKEMGSRVSMTRVTDDYEYWVGETEEVDDDPGDATSKPNRLFEITQAMSVEDMKVIINIGIITLYCRQVRRNVCII